METPPSSHRPFAPDHPMYVIFALLAAVLVCGLIGRLLAEAVAMSAGTSLEAWLSPEKTTWNASERLGLRALNLVIHLFTFTIASIVAIRLFYGRSVWSYFKLDLPPRVASAGYSILFVVASFPLAQLIYWLNRRLPLPQWMKSSEDAQNSMIEAMLQMDNPLEFALTLLTVAVVPALGEELLFRGVLQQQLTRWTRTEQAAIWITAFIFSAIHLQFEGFFARFLLGAVLGYVFLWTRNLWLPILAHFVFNGLQVVAKYALGDEAVSLDAEQSSPPNLLFGVAALLLLFLAGRWLASSQDNP